MSHPLCFIEVLNALSLAHVTTSASVATWKKLWVDTTRTRDFLELRLPLSNRLLSLPPGAFLVASPTRFLSSDAQFLGPSLLRLPPRLYRETFADLGTVPDAEGVEPLRQMAELASDPTPGTKVIFLQLTAADAAGTNMQFANHIMFGSTLNVAHSELYQALTRQARGRAIRHGQPKDVQLPGLGQHSLWENAKLQYSNDAFIGTRKIYGRAESASGIELTLRRHLEVC
ncbi:hypothetical protein GGR56DRAFT_679608 [Xylariaceae sp. FL0804]|nr:hypothetical protein GGR56DRAFT_679608 [Xylariaceae sp. FL0804]